MWTAYFQEYPLPSNQLVGTYNLSLVFLSFIVALLASYVALDITERTHDPGINSTTKLFWLMGGAIAMGLGIWSMHFIGMLAFVMDHTENYDLNLTLLSLIIAIVAAAMSFAFFPSRSIHFSYLALGGVLLGLTIAAMHYVGMAAMKVSMDIHYLPNLYFLSILIAIIAAEAALFLALKTINAPARLHTHYRIFSSFVLACGICGMHYTGMAAAVFTPLQYPAEPARLVDPQLLAIMVGVTTFFILILAIVMSAYQTRLSLREVILARQIGKAEVASSVLHNVGNLLNSVNISTTLIYDHLVKLETNDILQIKQLLEKHKDHLEAFIKSEKGKQLFTYISELSQFWKKELSVLQNEVLQLTSHIEHIKNAIRVQQSLSGVHNLEELCDINAMIDESLLIADISFDRNEIKVDKQLTPLEPVYLDKSKLIQILVNLIRNAKESVMDAGIPDKKITLRTGLTDDDKLFIQVADNGLGVSSIHQFRIFSHGFTTKKNGHGFGLHASAISAQEMNGSISVESAGENLGATFTLKLPYRNKA